ncbi:MAG: hypothetical protein LW818_09995 [Ignavibacteriae bacterium]|nr:hypothetical protein [Ignavibacteriota bacterium]
MKQFILIVTLSFPFVFELHALPQMSLLSGNRCSSCHVNQQGGGTRNDLGWYTYRDVSALQPAKGIMEDFWGIQDTLRDWIGAKSNIGFDMRFQYIRSRNPESEASFFPMQFSIYGHHQFTPWLGIEGAYNVGPIRYKGQQSWSGSVLLQPGIDLPQVRIGMFQPTIGIKNDDHTTLNRQIAADWLTPEILTPYSQMSLIAPHFASPGIELGYEGLHWLSVHAGVFSNAILNQNAVTHNTSGSLAFTSRIMFWPRFFENSLNTYIGASILVNGEMSITQFMLGVGLTDRLSLNMESTLSNISHDRSIEPRNISFRPGESRTVSAELMYQIEPWLLPYIRSEYAELNQDANMQSTIIRQFIIGAQMFLLPNVEFRPEYRIFDTYRPGMIGRWGAQLHLYY